MSQLILKFDGACRGNPGPGGAGYVAYHQSGNTMKRVLAGGFYVGAKSTCNFAEYAGLEIGLRKVLKLSIKYDEVIVRGDSRLVVEQVFGTWKCNHEHLRKIRDACKLHLCDFASRSIRVRGEHVYREHNVDADVLANNAVTRKANFTDIGDDLPAPKLIARARPPPTTKTVIQKKKRFWKRKRR